MKNIASCEYNMDTVCVEVIFSDGTKIVIDCTALENELEVNSIHQAELDWLIYNEPHTYVNLVLTGTMKEYLSLPPIHTLQDTNN